MKKKLLLLLMAGFSMVMLPSCGDDDDDANEQKTEAKVDCASLSGNYYGPLVKVEDGSSVADTLGVLVKGNANGTIDLALEQIVIMNIPVNNLSFPGVPCTYDAATKVYSFSATDLTTSIMGMDATVDVKEGKFYTENNQLDFVVAVKSPVAVNLKYSGKK